MDQSFARVAGFVSVSAINAGSDGVFLRRAGDKG
jgi:hypothetical protein